MTKENTKKSQAVRKLKPIRASVTGGRVIILLDEVNTLIEKTRKSSYQKAVN